MNEDFMLQQIAHITEEDKARRLLMRLGNGLNQVEEYLEKWRLQKKRSSLYYQMLNKKK